MKDVYHLEPIKKPHSNMVLKGWGDEVADLWVTKAFPPGMAVPFLYSTWKVESIWERLKLLFTGEVTIGVMGNTAPPITVSVGEMAFEEVSADGVLVQPEDNRGPLQ